jgi:hypothetical protein
MRWNCATSGSIGLIQQRPADRRTILRRCSSFRFAAISTGCNRAGGSSARLAAISRLAAVQLRLRPAGQRGEVGLYRLAQRTAAGLRAELSGQGTDAEIGCASLPVLARLRNPRGWNRCRLPEVVRTRFAPSETFGP